MVSINTHASVSKIYVNLLGLSMIDTDNPAYRDILSNKNSSTFPLSSGGLEYPTFYLAYKTHTSNYGVGIESYYSSFSKTKAKLWINTLMVDYRLHERFYVKTGISLIGFQDMGEVDYKRLSYMLGATVHVKKYVYIDVSYHPLRFYASDQYPAANGAFTTLLLGFKIQVPNNIFSL